MSKHVRLRNLKRVKQLSFEIPPPGVYLLSGANGAGKTSLLGCLHRIGRSNAFPLHFPMSEESEKLDNHSKAEIEYEVDGQVVIYRHAGQRWVPSPRKNSKLLNKFGYPFVMYVGATADRITPSPEDFSPKRLKSPEKSIIVGLNKIFDTKKFNGLKYINLTTGSGNRAYVMQFKVGSSNEYYSERNFSLGELCVLKLLKKVQDCPHNSLLLVDELELALHPKAQIQLVDYLREVSSEKNLTVIFSTHSVSLLKTADRKDILHLQQENGDVRLVSGCFPAYALGNIALSEESYPDRVVYVEDEAAKNIAESFVKSAILKKYQGKNSYPSVHVIPIGGFMAVMKFLGRGDRFLPSSTQCSALLDADVKEETVEKWKRQRDYVSLDFLESERKRIFYLPFTPECGLVEFLRDHGEVVQEILRRHFLNHRLCIHSSEFETLPEEKGPKQRDEAKRIVNEFCHRMSALISGETQKSFMFKLYEVFAECYFERHAGQVMRTMGPVIG